MKKRGDYNITLVTIAALIFFFILMFIIYLIISSKTSILKSVLG